LKGVESDKSGKWSEMVELDILRKLLAGGTLGVGMVVDKLGVGVVWDMLGVGLLGDMLEVVLLLGILGK
jgi:hypothetical protein